MVSATLGQRSATLAMRSCKKRDSSSICPSTAACGIAKGPNGYPNITSVKTSQNIVNRRKRQTFTKRYRYWTVDQWKMFSAAKIGLISGVFQSKIYHVHVCKEVWRTRKKNMEWGCLSWKEVGGFHRIKGILKQETCSQIILQQWDLQLVDFPEIF